MDKRRLQADIDRTMKKVAEGRQTFQDTLTKFEQAVTQIQREKFEADLKKEIKKLQRFRDQIKTWLTSNEIKDKKALSDARKDIEVDMERFKVIEKETKTKAYSKEGLGLEVKKDPLQKEKEEWEEWFKHVINELNIAMEKLEFEIEQQQTNAKKKRNVREKTTTVDAKRSKLEEVRSHVSWCETCMRSLDNDNLDLERLKDCKDEIADYCSQPNEYELDLSMYSDLIIDPTKLENDTFNVSGRALSLSDSDLSSVGERDTSVPDLIDESSSIGKSGSSLASSSATGVTQSSAADNNRQRHKSLDERPTLPVPTTTVPATTKTNSNSANPKPAPTPLPTHFPAVSKPSMAPPFTTAAPIPLVTTFSAAVASVPANSSVAPQTGPTPLLPGKSVPPSAAAIVRAAPSQAPVQPMQQSAHTSEAPVISSTTVLDTLSAATTVADPSVGAPPGLQSYGPPLLASAPSNGLTGNVSSLGDSLHSEFLGGLKGTQLGASLHSYMKPGPGMETLSSAGDTAGENAAPSFSTADLSHLLQRSLSLQQSSIFSESTSGSPAASGAFYSGTGSMVRQESMPVYAGGQSEERMSPLVSHRAFHAASAGPQSLYTSKGLTSNTTNGSSHDASVGYSSTLPFNVVGAPLLSQPSHDYFSNPAGTIGQGRAPGQKLTIPTQPNVTLTSFTMPLTDALAPFRNKNMTREQLSASEQLLEMGCRRSTRSEDSNRARMTLLKLPPSYETHYPQDSIDVGHTEEYYSKLDASTLFFIFYYFEGSRAQYLASRALKKKSWRFHKKDLLWFQRLEEPKSIDEEYESGTYVYWDPETKQQKKRDNFTFEYRFLEDSDLA